MQTQQAQREALYHKTIVRAEWRDYSTIRVEWIEDAQTPHYDTRGEGHRTKWLVFSDGTACTLATYKRTLGPRLYRMKLRGGESRGQRRRKAKQAYRKAVKAAQNQAD